MRYLPLDDVLRLLIRHAAVAVGTTGIASRQNGEAPAKRLPCDNRFELLTGSRRYIRM
jgi:hypothetical protein